MPKHILAERSDQTREMQPAEGGGRRWWRWFTQCIPENQLPVVPGVLSPWARSVGHDRSKVLLLGVPETRCASSPLFPGVPV